MRTYVLYLLMITSAASFAPIPQRHIHQNDVEVTPTRAISLLQATTRREIAFNLATATSVAWIGLISTMASAASDVPTKEDFERLKLGHENILYLLNNFEQETTVCRENGGECKRDSDAVRRALGLRSTNDPLFQIEKVFAKVKNMDLDPDKLDAFFEATEDWNTAMNMSNSMAFISQFGEYNPGGGKDAVLKYLEESRTQAIKAEKALKTILDCLDIA